MKKGDEVLITADDSNLSYIHKFNRDHIIYDPRGTVYHVYKDGCDVRTASGIWFIDKKHLEVV